LRLGEFGLHQRDDIEVPFLGCFLEQGALVLPSVVAIAVPEENFEFLVASLEGPVDVSLRLLGLKKKDSNRFPNVLEKCG
jgi:hypothetical protein